MNFPALHIRRLRASVPDGDGPAMRRRWERAFATADAVPAELGKEGVLVLRRVRWRAGPRRLSQLRPWLVEVRRRAARPATGAVPAGAEAVWFASEAELLACLARAAQSGALAGGWWWRALGLAADVASVARRWIEAPRAVPAALESLTREGRADKFLATLPPAHCRLLATAVADAFAMPALRTQAELVADAPAVSAHMPRRLRELIPESPPQVPPTALALWACCILLVRHPATARTAAVQELLSQWLAPAPGRTDNQEAAPVGSVPVEPAAEPDTPLRAAPLTPTPRPRASEPAGAPCKAVEQVVSASADLEGELKPTSPSAVAALPAGSLRFEVVGAATEPAPASTAADQRLEESEIQASPLRVRTAFGGVFYLLNVALDLGIYTDFTQPRGPNLALSPFDWLALLGRHWFGAGFVADPLWRLLAELAGRSPTEPPDFPEGMVGPEGWLAREAERVHKRLVAGLPETFAHALPDCVCRQDADVGVSHQRVEVRFALATHPLELRLSGLDRDPGWLPAAGREIYLSYD